MSNTENFRVRDKLTRGQILTIPNLLSFFRLALIPVIVWLYVFVKSPAWTTVVFLVSGLTDIVDGFIARKFNMVSDFGKAIDPIADKLTQLAMLLCLLTNFPLIALPITVMVVKEVGAFVLRLIVYKKAERVDSADWHGKVNTVLLYAIMLLHIIWVAIPEEISTVCILATTAMMILSCTLYSIAGARILIDHRRNKNNSEK